MDQREKRKPENNLKPESKKSKGNDSGSNMNYRNPSSNPSSNPSPIHRYTNNDPMGLLTSGVSNMDIKSQSNSLKTTNNMWVKSKQPMSHPRKRSSSLGTKVVTALPPPAPAPAPAPVSATPAQVPAAPGAALTLTESPESKKKNNGTHKGGFANKKKNLSKKKKLSKKKNLSKNKKKTRNSRH